MPVMFSCFYVFAYQTESVLFCVEACLAIWTIIIQINVRGFRLPACMFLSLAYMPVFGESNKKLKKLKMRKKVSKS